MLNFAAEKEMDMKTLKRILLAAAALAFAVACGQNKAPKVLVLYYSQTGTTKAVAEELQARLGADIEEILPVQAYDGSYQETISRGMQEMNGGSMPAIQPLKADVSKYDVIFLGYPVWFGTYANPIGTLLDEVDFSGKKLVPFCTFGSGGLDASAKAIKAKEPGAEVLPGYGVRAARAAAVPAEVDRFLKAGGFIAGEVEALEDFPAAHPVSEAESAIFDTAVGNYPMIHAKAVEVASRTVPGGTEYLFTAADLPREGAPAAPAAPFKVYVIAPDGQAPEFTQVVR